MKQHPEERDFRHGQPERCGVLLTNLGTPDAPTARAVRRYLAEFLWDPRVIESPRLLWWLILHGVILRIRPRRSAAAYDKIWTTAGSPLLVNANRQAMATSVLLDAETHADVPLALGMRYGNPSIAAALKELRDQHVRRVLVLPLYPQYSATTTASTFDAVAAALKRWRWLPELRFVTHYHDDPGFIEALAASVQRHWNDQGRGERLLFSFHGIPQRYFLNGDPYFCHCQKTARLVAERLELDPEQWLVSFQSRVGREEWLRPYTDETVEQLGRAKVKHLDVICPGFSADCLETLEEIVMQNGEIFEAAGGKRLSYIPALNDRPDHIRFLTDLLLRNLAGWIGREDQTALEASQRRALDLGAAQ